MNYGLDEIRTFLVVLETGSMSAAAARLNITKSVISQRIANLEAALNARLLHRSSRGVMPTGPGQEFAEHARAAIERLDAAAEAIAEGEDALVGALRVSAPMSFGVQFLGPVLFDFMRAHPGLGLNLHLSDAMADLSSEGYDLAIRITRIREDAPLVARKLAVSRRVICASPEYLRTHGEPASLAQLAGHVAIGYDYAGVQSLWQFEQAGGKPAAAPPLLRARVACNNGESMRDAAIAGLGMAVLPLFIACEALRSGRLRQVLPGVTPLPDIVYAVYRPGRHRLRRRDAVIEHLRLAFAGVPPWESGVNP
jgi:DNA-binding transcriptional LysR family regulator